MDKWDIGEAYAAMFGDHYSLYKGYVDKAHEFWNLSDQLFREMYVNVHKDNHGRIAGTIDEIEQAYRRLADNLFYDNYSWKGPAWRACLTRVYELYANIGTMKSAKHEAASALRERLNKQAEQCMEMARREVERFNVFDKVTQAVDEGAQEVKEELRRILSSL